MIVTNYTSEDMKKLPLRAIVAFSARCARRVERLAQPPDGHPETDRWGAAIADAIQVAEDFARGLPCPTADAAVRAIEACQEFVQGDLPRENAYAAIVRTAHAAATALHAIAISEEPVQRRLVSGGPPLDPLPPHLADISADLAALDAYTAAVDAADALGYADGFMVGVAEDYKKLLALKLGWYPEAGLPIDPSPEGPLGPLWPRGLRALRGRTARGNRGGIGEGEAAYEPAGSVPARREARPPGEIPGLFSWHGLPARRKPPPGRGWSRVHKPVHRHPCGLLFGHSSTVSKHRAGGTSS